MARSELVLVLAVLGTLLPVGPAAACSCAQGTLDEIVAREPGAAVAIVRRVDDASAGHVGRLAVIAELHGELPDTVTVALDDGGSCRPGVAPRQVAALSFRPDGDGWAAVDCGMLELGDALARVEGPLVPDPDAVGPPALVASGSFPGGDLLALDAELRVLAVAQVPEWLERVVPCGDDLVSLRMEGDTWVVERRTLPELTATEEHRFRRPAGWQPLALGCDDDGRVRAVATEDLPDGSTLVHRDLLGAPDDVITAPHVWSASLVGDEAWLVAPGDGPRAAELLTVDLGSGRVATRRTFDGLEVHELRVAPGGRQAWLRGSAEEPVLLVLDTATVTPVAQAAGWWMPVAGGWLGPDRLVLQDESRGVDEGVRLRIVDTQLRVLEEVTVPAGWPLALAGDAVVIGGGTELGVLRADGALHRSPDLRLAGTSQVLALGPVTGPPEAAAEPTTAPTSAPAAGSDDAPVWQLALATLATVAVVAALVALRRERRRRRR